MTRLRHGRINNINLPSCTRKERACPTLTPSICHPAAQSAMLLSSFISSYNFLSASSDSAGHLTLGRLRYPYSYHEQTQAEEGRRGAARASTSTSASRHTK